MVLQGFKLPPQDDSKPHFRGLPIFGDSCVVVQIPSVTAGLSEAYLEPHNRSGVVKHLSPEIRRRSFVRLPQLKVKTAGPEITSNVSRGR
jgi:hypothetical protein